MSRPTTRRYQRVPVPATEVIQWRWGDCSRRPAAPPCMIALAAARSRYRPTAARLRCHDLDRRVSRGRAIAPPDLDAAHACHVCRQTKARCIGSARLAQALLYAPLSATWKAPPTGGLSPMQWRAPRWRKRESESPRDVSFPPARGHRYWTRDVPAASQPGPATADRSALPLSEQGGLCRQCSSSSETAASSAMRTADPRAGQAGAASGFPRGQAGLLEPT